MVVVNFLLQLGFEVNYRDYARKTALFFAIENGHLDVADFLIERAASIKVQSKEKKTPLSMLKALNHKAPQNQEKVGITNAELRMPWRCNSEPFCAVGMGPRGVGAGY